MSTSDGALGAWLTGTPGDASDARLGWWRTHQPDTGRVPEPQLSGADATELAEMRGQLELTRARAALQRDPAWLDELSPDERAEERQAAETIRALRRTQSLRAATATEKLHGRAQRVERRIAGLELSDRLWARRAATRRTRLLDPTSRLASLQRTHLASSVALIAVAGILWTSRGVHDALVGPDGTILAYLVEPIFSVPLLVIMGLSAQATQWNRTFPPPAYQARVYWLEAFLLTATLALNTVGVLPGLGAWTNVATLLAHLVPPVLIVIAVTLQPLVAGFLADILATTDNLPPPHSSDTHVSPASPVARTEPRLGPDTITILALVARVHAAVAAGHLQPWDNTGLPSISAIQRHLRCEKRRAQAVWDALHLLTHDPNNRTHRTDIPRSANSSHPR